MDGLLALDVCSIKIENEVSEEMLREECNSAEIHLTNESGLKQEYEDDNEIEIEDDEDEEDVNDCFRNEELEPPICVTLPDHGDVLQEEFEQPMCVTLPYHGSVLQLEKIEDPLSDISSISNPWIKEEVVFEKTKVEKIEDPLSDISSISNPWIKEEGVFEETPSSEDVFDPSMCVVTSMRASKIPSYANSSYYEPSEYIDRVDDPWASESKSKWIKEAKHKVEMHIQEVRRLRKYSDIDRSKNNKSKSMVNEKIVMVPNVVFVPPLNKVTSPPCEVKTRSPPLQLSRTKPRPKPRLTHGPEWEQWVLEEKARLEQHILEVRERRKLNLVREPEPRRIENEKKKPGRKKKKHNDSINTSFSTKVISPVSSKCETEKEESFANLKVVRTIKTVKLDENVGNYHRVKTRSSLKDTDPLYSVCKTGTINDGVTGNYRRGRGRGREGGRVLRNHLTKSSRIGETSNSVLDFAVRETFSCSDCGLCFYSELDLKEHNLLLAASMEGSFSCVQCSCEFSSCCALTQHQTTHVKIETSPDCNEQQSTSLRNCEKKLCELYLPSLSLEKCVASEELLPLQSITFNNLNDGLKHVQSAAERHILADKENYSVKNHVNIQKKMTLKRGTKLNSGLPGAGKSSLKLASSCENLDKLRKNNILKKKFVSKSPLVHQNHTYPVPFGNSKLVLKGRENILVNTNESIKRHKCPTCKKMFSQLNELQSHICVFNGSKSFTCNVCGKNFSSKGNLKVHIQKHSDSKPFRCTVCHKCFDDPSNFKRHSFIHLGHESKSKFICETCGHRFCSNYSLKNHQISMHTNITYECKNCGKHFKRTDSLTEHMLTIHGNERKYKCDICGKAFALFRALRKHLRFGCSSNKEKKMKCEICGKVFAYRSDLERHFLVHTHECPFECEHCKRKFKVKSNLVKHILSSHPVD